MFFFYLFCSSSPQKLVEITTSTPHPTYKPRVNFRSIESLAISSLNTSSLTPNSSPFSFQRHGKLLSNNLHKDEIFKVSTSHTGHFFLRVFT
jgi:hypothetical protein